MGDYSFLMTNCLDITVEMYCEKYPRPNRYKKFKGAVLWQTFSLMDFLLTAHWGIKGVVRSRRDNLRLHGAQISSMDIQHSTRFAQKPTVASKLEILRNQMIDFFIYLEWTLYRSGLDFKFNAKKNAFQQKSKIQIFCLLCRTKKFLNEAYFGI